MESQQRRHSSVRHQALELAQRWLRRDYVVGVAIGQRRRKDNFRPQLCVVVTVTDKVERPEQLRRAPFPRHLELRHAGRTHRVPVDVQETAGRPAARLQGLIAGPVANGGESIGAVGAYVAWQNNWYALTAGHVGRTEGRVLQVDGVGEATVARLFMSNRVDYALLGPLGTLPAGASHLPGGEKVSLIRNLDESFIGQPAYCYSPQSGEERVTTVRQMSASVAFEKFLTSSGGTAWVQMHGLLAVDSCTEDGDSGTLLYDAGHGALGTLVGILEPYSYFLPCDVGFARTSLSLAVEQE